MMKRTRLLLSHFPTLTTLIFHGCLTAATLPEVKIGIPADLARQPAASNCQALRSATYRIISPTLGGTLADQTGKATLDARTLEFTRADGTGSVWQSQSTCRFSETVAEGYSVDYVVSQTGFLAGRVSVNGGSSYRNVFGFPQQTHGLAELAGTWNTLGFRGPAGGFYAGASSLSFDRNGTVWSATECASPVTWATDSCVDVPASDLKIMSPYLEDASGGFVSKIGTRTSRLFLYQAAGGPPMMVGIGSDGAMFFGTPARAMALPVVGTTRTRWNLDMTGGLASTTNTYTTIGTEVSVDVETSSWVRKKKGLLLPDEHLEKLFANRPRDGYSTRPAGEAPTSAGSTVRFNELTALTMTEIGIQVVILPKVKLFELVVIAP